MAVSKLNPGQAAWPDQPMPMMMTEARIRELLVAKLSASAAGQGAAFISELFVDGFQRRADLVMANGSLAAFEIKSERDTLERLDGQLECYQRLFELVTVVCAERHLQGVLDRADPVVGVWAISNTGKVRHVRQARKGAPLSQTNWVSHLPVDELRALLRASGLSGNGSRTELSERASEIAAYRVRTFVLDYLKRRDQRIEKLRQRRRESRLLTNPPAQSRDERLRAFLEQVSTAATVATPRLVKAQTSSSPISSSSSGPSVRWPEKSICRAR